MTIGSSVVYLSGLATVGLDGQQITGSAASTRSEGSAVSRSYFELLERASVIGAIGDDRARYELRDRAGRSLRTAERHEVFPDSYQADRSRPSRSNGVAIHLTWQEACDRAAAELVERDRILRSWYGETRPHACAVSSAFIPDGLQLLANWSSYELPRGPWGIGGHLTAICVVGVPRADTTPLVYGFSANTDKEAATRAAAVEAIQRFGFLFGETIPKESPAFSATPDFHQEFFLFPASHRHFFDWLNGTQGLALQEESGRELRHDDGDEILFVDLTPKHLQGSLFVAKALCPSAEPLFFGDPAPHRANCSPSRRVHPIA